ncbi:versiconal hemiacetal acetate reductase protein [Rutstroemia sp. NJR-2017a BBW]|nr:versiconal hemiacetal acetate reductase protein [Rutstroemia sp. NJR-2017a BBW]
MSATNEAKMEYTRLGKSGLKISKVILGAMSFGSSEWQDWVLNEDDALPLLKHAYDVGLNTWDTADVYSNGRSEEIVGKALKEYSIPRNKVVILTRLGTYIDVLQIHRLDRDTPREEIMKALNDVVESGKVRYIGASSNIADKHGWHKFVSMQNYYNLLYREEEREMIPYCRDTGVGLIPWSPIARGALARPFDDRSTTREKSDRMLNGIIRGKETEIDKTIIGRVEEIAKKKGVSMATIATAWCLSKNSVNPIIGLSSKERIDQTVESVKFASSGKLTEEDIKYLEECYAPKVIQGY